MAQQQAPSIRLPHTYEELVAHNTLRNAAVYLRQTSGRTETEGPRRILTTALKLVGTDAVVDLKNPYIARRLHATTQS